MAAVFFPEQSSNFFCTPKNMIFIFHVDVTGTDSVRPHEKIHRVCAHINDHRSRGYATRAGTRTGTGTGRVTLP